MFKKELGSKIVNGFTYLYLAAKIHSGYIDMIECIMDVLQVYRNMKCNLEIWIHLGTGQSKKLKKLNKMKETSVLVEIYTY